MILDDKLKSIIATIKNEVEEKYKKELSEEDIFNVIDSQIEATKEGIRRSITVHWFKFGKFLFTNKKVRMAKIQKNVEYLSNTGDYTNSEIEAIQKQLVIESAKEKKHYIRQNRGDQNLQDKELNAEQVLAKEKVITTKLKFTLINKKKI
jgi:hypothetical protein